MSTLNPSMPNIVRPIASTSDRLNPHTLSLAILASTRKATR